MSGDDIVLVVKLFVFSGGFGWQEEPLLIG